MEAGCEAPDPGCFTPREESWYTGKGGWVGPAIALDTEKIRNLLPIKNQIPIYSCHPACSTEIILSYCSSIIALPCIKNCKGLAQRV
jgi:hypothetical protein